MRPLFHKFFRNIAKSFIGRNLLWPGAAIILTYLIVASGLDWKYYQATRSDVLGTWGFPAAILGGLLPIFVPLGILAVGHMFRKARWINTAWALGQAALIGWLVSSAYKTFTGRVHPPISTISTVDISHMFQFGILRGGVFWGWPSSHTTIAFAMAITLILLYRRNRVVMFFSLLYALYIGLGVSVTIHWFSEAVAGTLIGLPIGIIVGRTFRERLASLTSR